MKTFLIGLGLVVFGVWAFNTSRFTQPAEGSETRLLAHRGVHQTYSREDLGRDDCTATRIEGPSHGYLENTIASMRAAFAAGADVVELDIHQTADGHFAVFHDWTLDCRTEGEGETRKATRATLKALDIGYGYTADGGETYPFRGAFVGAMPMLDEVFAAFPERRFLVNLKSNRERDGEAFAAFMRAHPEWMANVLNVYGDARAVEAVDMRFDGYEGFSAAQTRKCLKTYVMWGWSGRVPKACRNIQIVVPISHAPYLWGWPHKLTARMKAAGSDVALTGPYTGRRWGAGGLDTAEDAARVPAGFDGYIWTNRVQEIAPLIDNRG